MIATIKNLFWVSMVGTYGVASAQFYWSRVAALLTQLAYHMSEESLWVMVFVDDFMLLLRAIFLLFLSLVGCPLSEPLVGLQADKPAQEEKHQLPGHGGHANRPREG